MAVGFILCHFKTVSDKLSTVISQLLMQVMLPALCFKTFSSSFTTDNLARNSTYILYGAIMLAAVVGLGLVFSHFFSRDRNTRAIYLYTLAIPNIGYLGYPFILAVFGEQALATAMVIMIPQNIFIYSVGVYLLDPDKKMTFKKLFNPIIVSMLLGAAVGLTGLALPDFVKTACNSAAACMTPLAMIMAGFVLARMPFKELVLGVKPYIAALLRLFVIPTAMFFGMRALSVPAEVILIVTAIEVMPCGLNAVVFPESHGGDSRTGAKVCFVSTVLCIFTIPIMLSLAQGLL